MSNEVVDRDRRRSSRFQWYVLALVSLTFFFTNAERLCLPVLFQEILGDLGLSLVQVGMVWGMDPLAGVFVSIFSGLLVDRFGVKHTVTVIIFFVGIFGLLRGLSVNFLSLSMTMFLFGLLVATTPTILPKVIALWFKGPHLGLANGIMICGSSFGGMVAAMLSATVLSPLFGGWRAVLFFYGFPPIAFSVIWLITYRGKGAGGSSRMTDHTVSFSRAFSHVFRIKDAWAAGVLQFGGFGAYVGMLGYLPLYLRGIGWSPAVADSAATVLIGAIGSSSIPISRLSDRIGSRKRVLLPVFLTWAIALCLMPLVGTVTLWILIVLSGLLIGGMSALSMALIMEIKGIDGAYVGTALGLASSLSMLGAFISPPLGNSVAYIHEGLPFVLWGLLAGIVTIAFFFISEGGGSEGHASIPPPGPSTG
jgi:MFS family permease